MVDEIITPDMAAVFETRPVTGWWTADGKQCFQDEDAARYAGATHVRCECGAIIPKSRVFCDACKDEKEKTRWLAMPEKVWNEKEPICEIDGSNYFFSADDLVEHCERKEIDPYSLRLVDCIPEYLHHADEEMWNDMLVDNIELSEDILNAIDELNKSLDAFGVVSYLPGKKRIILEPKRFVRSSENGDS